MVIRFIINFIWIIYSNVYFKIFYVWNEHSFLPTAKAYDIY